MVTIRRTTFHTIWLTQTKLTARESITIQLASILIGLDLVVFVHLKATYFLVWSDPIQVNWRPAIQCSFSLQKVFSDCPFKAVKILRLNLFARGVTLFQTVVINF